MRALRKKKAEDGQPPKPVRHQVIRDSREKDGQGWTFAPSTRCSGTVVATLKTGDYTLAGLEDRFVIERKGAVAEYAANLFQARFARELDRLDAFEHPYLFLEFSFGDLLTFPATSGIPRARWKFLRATGPLLVKAHHELRIRHPRLRVEFVGAHGKDAAASLFKRMADLHAG